MASESQGQWEESEKKKKEAKLPKTTEQAINSQLLLIWLIKERLLALTPGEEQARGACLRVTVVISATQWIHTGCLV